MTGVEVLDINQIRALYTTRNRNKGITYYYHLNARTVDERVVSIVTTMKKEHVEQAKAAIKAKNPSVEIR